VFVRAKLAPHFLALVFPGIASNCSNSVGLARSSALALN